MASSFYWALCAYTLDRLQYIIIICSEIEDHYSSDPRWYGNFYADITLQCQLTFHDMLC